MSRRPRYNPIPDRTESEYTELADYLRVLHFGTPSVGGGAPDKLFADPQSIKARGIWLVEIKNDGNKLNPRQVAFHEKWKNIPPVVVFDTPDLLQAAVEEARAEAAEEREIKFTVTLKDSDYASAADTMNMLVDYFDLLAQGFDKEAKKPPGVVVKEHKK